MMKKNYTFYLVVVLLMVSCYSDDSDLKESSDVAHRSSELTSLIKSVAKHDAAFDDLVDDSSCFSIVFPYQLYVNSELKNVRTSHDISNLTEEDDIQIVFPVSVTFFNYETFQVNSYSELNRLKSECEDQFTLEPNSCIDFAFPITIKEFNEFNTTFETLHFYHNKGIYQYLDQLHDSDVYEIQYPIVLLDLNSRSFEVDSNSDLISALETSQLDCE